MNIKNEETDCEDILGRVSERYKCYAQDIATLLARTRSD